VFGGGGRQMNELKIIEYQNQRVLLTSQLAESYGTDSKSISYNFNHNKERYDEGKHFYLLQGLELKAFREFHDLPNNINKVYLWTERGAFLHAKSLNTDKAWEVYDSLVEHYFKSREAKPSMLPSNYKEALLQLVAQVEENERLQLENQEMKPKAEYFNALVDRNLLTNFRDTAKELKLKQNEFIDYLLNCGYIYRDQRHKLKPYSKYVDDGLFELKEFTSRYSDHTDLQTMVTPKGRETFRLLFR